MLAMQAWAGPALRCSMQKQQKNELKEIFERTIDAIAHDAEFSDVEIVQYHARPAKGLTALSVTIDRTGGVDVALCERVAARINASLDWLEDPYELQVESAGLERPLVKGTDFQRFAGMPARIVTSLAIAGSKTHRGLLRGLRRDNVVLETSEGELLLPPATIRSARLEFDPRADLRREKRERKGTKGGSRN